MDGLEGRMAVVTGGARGIGRAIAEAFLQQGADVALIDRNGETLANTAAELERMGSVESIELDVRDWDAIGEALAGIAARRGRLDICVNNAGTTRIGASTELDRDSWQEVVDVNLTGVFIGAQAAAREMISLGAGGSIVNMASAAALLGLPGRAPYCATKGAVISLTKVLGVEWAEHGIRVNAIGPGWVKTSFVQAAIDDGHLSEEGVRRRTPMDRLAKPEEIAAAAVFLASDAASYMTGQTIFPDGGFTSYGAWA